MFIFQSNIIIIICNKLYSFPAIHFTIFCDNSLEFYLIWSNLEKERYYYLFFYLTIFNKVIIKNPSIIYLYIYS